VSTAPYDARLLGQSLMPAVEAVAAGHRGPSRTFDGPDASDSAFERKVSTTAHKRARGHDTGRNGGLLAKPLDEL